MTQTLYHCQFVDYSITEDPIDMFIWASSEAEVKKILAEAVDDDENLKPNGVTAKDFHIYTVYAENGGWVKRKDLTDGQVWFSPNRVAELGLIKDNKGVGNYRFIVRLIKDGKLKAEKEKGGFRIHKDWIDNYNSSQNM